MGQGLPAPRGAEAWTELGLNGIAQFAQPLRACAIDDLWRALLDLAVAEFCHLRPLIAQMETKLNVLAKADAEVQRLETVPGVGPQTA